MQRICDVCGEVDEAPRHTIVHPVGGAPETDQAMIQAVIEKDLPSDVKASVIADLADTTVQLRHFTCCKNAGCPDGTCDTLGG